MVKHLLKHVIVECGLLASIVQLLSGVLCHVEKTCLKSVHLHAGDLL